LHLKDYHNFDIEEVKKNIKEEEVVSESESSEKSQHDTISPRTFKSDKWKLEDVDYHPRLVINVDQPVPAPKVHQPEPAVAIGQNMPLSSNTGVRRRRNISTSSEEVSEESKDNQNSSSSEGEEETKDNQKSSSSEGEEETEDQPEPVIEVDQPQPDLEVHQPESAVSIGQHMPISSNTGVREIYIESSSDEDEETKDKQKSSSSDEEEDNVVSDEGREDTLERDDEEVKYPDSTEPSDKFNVAGEKEVREAVILPDGSTYTGEWLGDKQNGQGKVVFKDGSTYEGEWKAGKPHGYGERIHFDGSRYKGQFANGKADGYGEFHHGNRGLYIGHWKNDTKHGESCKEVWPDGTTYQGVYQNGLMHDKGLLIYSDTSMYDGDFVKGQM
jgi:hypothetical protein